MVDFTFFVPCHFDVFRYSDGTAFFSLSFSFLTNPSQAGLIGFLLVLAMSRISSKKDEKAVQFEASSATPSTPNSTPRKSRGTPIENKTGSVMTPGGRRSARLARRKED